MSTNALAYEVRVDSRQFSEATLRKQVVGVFGHTPDGDRERWLVAATLEEGLTLRGLPGVIGLRQLGQVIRNGDNVEFTEPDTGHIWRVPFERRD
jgi:hypothetical protein